jgi:hypothetical protein
MEEGIDNIPVGLFVGVQTVDENQIVLNRGVNEFKKLVTGTLL